MLIIHSVINPITDLIDVLIIYTTGYEQASYSFQFSIDAESFKMHVSVDSVVWG